MLLREDGDAVVCIGQPAHAWLSGQLARSWALDPVEPWEEVCLAAEQHDLGMAAWDAVPELNPETGRPYSFMEMPLDTHLRLWTAAPSVVMLSSPASGSSRNWGASAATCGLNGPGNLPRRSQER